MTESQSEVTDALRRIEAQLTSHFRILASLEKRYRGEEGAVADDLGSTLPPDSQPPASPVKTADPPTPQSESKLEDDIEFWRAQAKAKESDLDALTADKEALWDQLEAVEEQKSSLEVECALLRRQVQELKMALETREESEASVSASILSRSPSMSFGDGASPLLNRGGSPIPRSGSQGEATLFGFKLRYPTADAYRKYRQPVKRPDTSRKGVVAAKSARIVSLSSPNGEFTNGSFGPGTAIDGP